MKSNMICDVPHLGTHWFNPNALTNIISLSHMADKFKVTFDSLKERSMLVHMPNKVVRFRQINNGLYSMDPNDKTETIGIKSKKSLQFINTVEENLFFLSPRQQ